MSHLTPAEMIDLLEGTLPEARRAHASECARCRDEATQTAVTFATVRAAEIPEPSPLYWDHFSLRVHNAIRQAPARAGWGRVIEWRGALAAAAAVMLIVIGTTLSWRAGIDAPARVTSNVPAVTNTAENDVDVAPPTLAPESDTDWDVVAGVADGMEWDAAREAGFAVKPGAAEHAVLQLTDEQREELGRMLQAEIARLKS
jgi:hypothetical protein